MTEESDWSYASKQKLAVVKAIKGIVFVKLCLVSLSFGQTRQPYSLQCRRPQRHRKKASNKR